MKTFKNTEKELNKNQKGLLEQYYPLVRKVVNTIRLGLPSFIDANELHSAGTMGLVDAIKKIDIRKFTTYKGYIVTRIRGAIFDELRKFDYMPRSARAEAKKIAAEKEILEAQLGRPATEDELRNRLKISKKQFEKLMRRTMSLSFQSIHENRDREGENISISEILPDENSKTAVEEIQEKELSRSLRRRVENLPERQKKIIQDYYFGQKKFSDIANSMNLTEARICQIHGQAINQLNKSMLS